MRKLFKLLLFVGILVIVLGGVCIGIAFATNGFNKVEITQKTEEIEGDFSNIDICLEESNIEFFESTDGKTKLVYDDTEKIEQEIIVKDATLKIKEEGTYKWYERLFVWNISDLNYKLYLTKNTFENLKIDGTTGNVSINNYEFKEVLIDGTTGNVKLSNINVVNDLNVDITTGNCKLTKVNASNLTIEITTGNVNLEDVIITNNINIDGATGNVKFTRIDAETINIELTTGDVKGSILTDKTFNVSTTTGSKSYPTDTRGGKCTIVVTTGDVKVTVEN